MDWHILRGALSIVLGLLAFRGMRWAYVSYVFVGMLYFPVQSGFHFHTPVCQLALDVPLALMSLRKIPHIVLFGLFFLMTFAQFRKRTLSAFALAGLITVIMGAIVELEEGLSGIRNCRLLDLVPDAAGALIGMAVAMVWNTARVRRVTNTGGRVVQATLAGGLTAGALDIAAAFVVYGLRGATPVRVLQSIAAGILGSAAFQGGARTAALGLALHFIIAMAAALAYSAASLAIGVLIRRPIVCGALYGIAVYLFMNFVVLPLSALPKRPFSPDVAAVIVGVHVVCVGIPIAMVARSFLRGPAE